MKKSILITRPKTQAQEIVQYLQNNNFEVFVEPTFAVQNFSLLQDDLLQKLSYKNISAIIVTSGNATNMALEVIKKLNLGKEIKIFAVGKKTSLTFSAVGYENIIYAKENSAEGLKKIILQDAEILAKKEDVLLYFCGEFISLDFKEELAKYSLKLEKIISYKIIENDSFSSEFLKIAKESNFDFVLLYSRNSAKHFFELSKKHNLLECFKSSQILCLSEKILSFVRSSGFNNSITFDENIILKKFYE